MLGECNYEKDGAACALCGVFVWDEPGIHIHMDACPRAWYLPAISTERAFDGRVWIGADVSVPGAGHCVLSLSSLVAGVGAGVCVV